MSEEYECPCQNASPPYWKAKETALPQGLRLNMLQRFGAEDHPEYQGTPYFRLRHTPESIPAVTEPPALPAGIYPQKRICAEVMDRTERECHRQANRIGGSMKARWNGSMYPKAAAV